jgi:DNA-binding LytR/AlgR family response regulator
MSNTSLRCLALDDEPLALQLIEKYAAQVPMLAPKGFFNNPDQALARLEVGDIDLLFLDIQMPDITGLQFFKQLKKPPMVIFTTAYPQFAVDGFNLDAIDYLLKPFDFQRFEKAVTKAVEYQKFNDQLALVEHSSRTSIFVKAGYSVVQIQVDDIHYIEGFDDYIKIHASGKPILSLLPLKNILQLLPPERFMRIHRSFIVAVDKIERIRAQKITIHGREIPIGNTFKIQLKERFTRDRLD